MPPRKTGIEQKETVQRKEIGMIEAIQKHYAAQTAGQSIAEAVLFLSFAALGIIIAREMVNGLGRAAHKVDAKLCKLLTKPSECDGCGACGDGDTK